MTRKKLSITSTIKEGSQEDPFCFPNTSYPSKNFMFKVEGDNTGC